MLRLNSKREHMFQYTNEEDDTTASFYFKFPFVEDRNYGAIKKLLKQKLINTNDQEEAIKDITQNAQYIMIRESLYKWENIVDEDGKELLVVDTDGKIIEYNQKVVFEFLRYEPDLWEQIETAFSGVQLKN